MKLLHRSLYIRFPAGENLNEVITGFKEKWGVPQCAGSVDGTRIIIIPPFMNHTDYYNWTLLLHRQLLTTRGFSEMCIFDGWEVCMMHESSRILPCTERPKMVSYFKVMPRRSQEEAYPYF